MNDLKKNKTPVNSHIIILGYMACGKSSVGKYLEKQINLKFIDLDEIIERTEDMTISNIFKSKGEVEFRKIENKILIETLNLSETSIISLGGGTPCYFNNMNVINSNSKNVFFLNTPNEILSKRLYLEKDSRPLISHFSSLSQIKEFVSKHIFERTKFYNMAAHKIYAGEKKIEEISNEIITIIS